MVNDFCIQPIAEDTRSKALLDIARKAANSKATILINGETGVGKELLARYIHQHSPFSEGPFVSVNCAALPENMIEALLFGYEKGAFTGAVNTYVGKFEQAQNGTLLLDEISELPFGLQAKLLRVLQEREIERLCGKKIIKINIRVIAATNRDLRQQVMLGMFRKDLFYRLSVVPIQCAALRERPLDIVPLAEYFIKLHAEALGKEIPELSSSAKKKMVEHSWPGNIREMENVIQHTLIMTNNQIINPEDIALSDEMTELTNYDSTVENFDKLSSQIKIGEAQVIINALKETDGQRNDAAKKLNISPRTLRYKISKLKSLGVKVP